MSCQIRRLPDVVVKGTEPFSNCWCNGWRIGVLFAVFWYDEETKAYLVSLWACALVVARLRCGICS